MTELVPAGCVERIVGILRHPNLHYGRAVSDEQKVYILHSMQCLKINSDLRNCSFSLSLNMGIDISEWIEDIALEIVIDEATGRIIPVRTFFKKP